MHVILTILNIQLSGFKYIHIVVQSLSVPIFRNFFIIPNWNSEPITV